jgi:glycosyltransferase involved in cell wall biosynthesis
MKLLNLFLKDVSECKEITFPHPPVSHGGPGSFQERFEKGLKKKGWKVTYQKNYVNPSVVFVIGGTKKLFWLISLKLRGKKIIQRLDGLNWQHRVKWPGLREWFKAEARELLVRFIRRFVANVIVYQTNFISNWWDQNYGPINKKSFIVKNGVDLSEFHNLDLNNKKKSYEIVCVEGAVRGDPAYHILSSIKSWKVNVYGTADKTRIDLLKKKGLKNINFFGSIPRNEIHKVFKKGSIFLNLEIIPPCPNSVIEAMSRGLPVISYNTGSIKELVGEDSGLLMPYGSNPWKLENPNTKDLEMVIKKVFSNYDYYSINARNRAESLFDLDLVVNKYIQIFEHP